MAVNTSPTAAQTAKTVVDQAAITATNVLASETTITKALSEALRDVFGEKKASGRFIDVSRIPLICKSIIDMHDSIKDINNKLDNKFITRDQFSPIQRAVYGVIGLMLSGIIIAVLINIGLKLR